MIGRAGVGVDNIDADAATRRGIVVMNTPGANAIAVAELTIGLMLALARQLPRANDLAARRQMGKEVAAGSRAARASNLAFSGLGRVGLEVARRAKGIRHGVIGP